MNKTEEEGLDAAMYLSELIRDVLYNQERYKLWARMYCESLIHFNHESSTVKAARSVKAMDAFFEPMSDDDATSDNTVPLNHRVGAN